MKRHEWSYRLFPFRSLRLEQLLGNARLGHWIQDHPEVPRLRGRSAFYQAVSREVASEAIDYLEFGVFEGRSMREWISLNANPASKFYGFDSFEGLPEAWGRTKEAGDFNVGGEFPNISDSRVEFHKGWFQESLPKFLENFVPRRLVLNLDADLHSSTIYALTKMDHLIKVGTIIIFDEFVSSLHEFRAYNDYCAAYLRDMRPIAMTDDFATQVAFMVTR